jgi:hypothetical protein
MHHDAFDKTALGGTDHTSSPKIPSINDVQEPAAPGTTKRIDALDPLEEYRNGGDLVIEEQPMTAIYENNAGAIVIRQLDASGYTDDDPFVRFLPHYAPSVIRKIAELAGYHVSISREPIAFAASAERISSPRRNSGEPSLFGEQS